MSAVLAEVSNDLAARWRCVTDSFLKLCLAPKDISGDCAGRSPARRRQVDGGLVFEGLSFEHTFNLNCVQFQAQMTQQHIVIHVCAQLAFK